MGLETALGKLVLGLRPDAAPATVEHFLKLVETEIYNGSCFYRSDVVIQFGLQRPDGTRPKSPLSALSMNETGYGLVLSNTRGMVALAHWDIPDCGNSEMFISLQSNVEFDII